LKYNKTLICAAAVLLTLVMGTAAAQEPKELLGEFLFFDEDLSTPPGQSCATCHDPDWGFTGPDSEINNAGAVYPGAIHTRTGNRKPPTAAYGGDSPVLYYDETEDVFIGGMFWDGRATGWTLGDPLAEQAMGPFLNTLEQNNPDARLVCIKVRNSDYADLFEEAWGPDSLDCVKDVAGTYEKIARSIAAYERSGEVNPYNSTYDANLTGDYMLTENETWGLELFEGKAMCSECHISEEGPSGEPPLFTDFTYDNLGIPKNPENPFYSMPYYWNPDGMDWVDYGLGGFLRSEYVEIVHPDWYPMADQNDGKHKVPTLRNVDKRPPEGGVKAYGHNGYFKSLEEIVHFYNTRDVPDAGWNGELWPDPEVPENVNVDELGDLGLTDEEEDAIVAFMKTLSDGYEP
jgi:cytochrome c peroxidase